MLLLAEIATSQPHAAYAAFVHGLSSRRTYLSRTIPGVSDLFQPLEDAIHQVFIPAKTEIRASNRQHSEDRAKAIYSQLTPQLKRCVDLAKERGASSWLAMLPLSEQGFHLHKGEFRDALCLRYGWSLSNTPRLCNCVKAFTVNHAMVCHMGGFLA